MHRGSLFILLYFIIAPSVAVGLLWRGVRRAIREPNSRWKILGDAAMALGLWWLGSYCMFAVTFVTTWDVAHTRPFPDVLFPEGWLIYAWLAVYAAVGRGLIVALGRVPPARESNGSQ